MSDSDVAGDPAQSTDADSDIAGAPVRDAPPWEAQTLGPLILYLVGSCERGKWGLLWFLNGIEAAQWASPSCADEVVIVGAVLYRWALAADAPSSDDHACMRRVALHNSQSGNELGFCEYDVPGVAT